MPNELQRLHNDRIRYMVALEQLVWFEWTQAAHLDYAAAERNAWRMELWQVLTATDLEELTV